MRSNFSPPSLHPLWWGTARTLDGHHLMVGMTKGEEGRAATHLDSNEHLESFAAQAENQDFVLKVLKSRTWNFNGVDSIGNQKKIKNHWFFFYVLGFVVLTGIAVSYGLGSFQSGLIF